MAEEEQELLNPTAGVDTTTAPAEETDPDQDGHGEHTIRIKEMKKKPKRKDEIKEEKERQKKEKAEQQRIRYYMRPKASYYEHNMVGAACISLCALAPMLLSIFALVQVVEDMNIDPELVGEEEAVEDMDLGGEDDAQAELFDVLCIVGFSLDILVAFLCMLNGMGGLFAISSRLISQTRAYLRGLLIMTGLFVLPSGVYAAYVIINQEALYFHWPFGEDEELSVQSKGPTIVLFLLVLSATSVVCMLFYYYGALMWKDELKEENQNRLLLKQGKNPPPARVAPWWLQFLRYATPTQEQIKWFCTDPVVGVSCLVTDGCAHLILGGLSVSETYGGGFYLLAGGLIRILIALYGYKVIKEKSPLKIFQYGRLLILGLLLFVISVIAFVGAMTREPPSEDDAEDIVVRTESPDFLTAIGLMVGVECLGLFWCMYCAIDHAKYLQDVAIIQKTSAIESFMKGLEEGPPLPAGGAGVPNDDKKKKGKSDKNSSTKKGSSKKDDSGAGVAVSI